jgi:hypothetical protein
MSTRNEQIELAKANLAAWDRFHFNAGKVRFLSYTKAGVFAYETYGDQLEAMKVEAEAARDAFTAAVAGMSTEATASIMVEAMGQRVAA